MNRKIKSITVRFWSKVDKKSDNECWNWVGAKDQKGYGMIGYENKVQRAHRVSYIIHFGNFLITRNNYICHTCDNPSCVNPNHLFLGTHADNMRDMYKKGRGNDLKGEHHPNHKLTDYQRKEIIDLRLSTHLSYRKIAKIYGVTDGTIINVLRNGDEK